MNDHLRRGLFRRRGSSPYSEAGKSKRIDRKQMKIPLPFDSRDFILRVLSCFDSLLGGGRKKMKKVWTGLLIFPTVFFLMNTAHADLNKELVGYWNFDHCDAANSDGKDSKGKIYGDPTCVDGVFGKAFEFDGNNDYIEINDNPSFQVRTFSVCAWVFPAQLQGNKAILERGNQKSYYLILEDAKPVIGFYGGKASPVSLKARTNLQENRWNFVCGVYDGKELKIYINGEPDHSKPVKLKKKPVKASVPMRIGHDFRDRYFSGLLDEIRIYHRVLSKEEIRELYAAGNSESESYPIVENIGDSDRKKECQSATFNSETDILYIPDLEMDGKHYKVFMLKGEGDSNFKIIKKTPLD